MIRTAPEGRWFIAGAWVIALALVTAAVRTQSTGWIVGAVLWTLLALWVVAFFRDPERAWSLGERLIVAPADGKVVSVIEVDEPAFFGGRIARPDPLAGLSCPGCEAESEAEERYLATLRNGLLDSAVRAKYQAGDGLCLPHIDRALSADDEGARVLADAATEMLGTIVADLDEYIRKHDYRFSTPVWDGGEDTPERAVERAVGQRPPPQFTS